MTAKNTGLDPQLHAYILANTLRESPLLTRLREETAAMPNAQMQIGPEQGAFMALLARAIGARRYLEVGVFTGYSALAVASALPDDGSVVACDVSEEYTAVARRYWREGGVAAKIDLRIAPALQTLDELVAADAEPFDMAFIDADKVNSDAYYERALRLLRRNGLLLVDNALQDGGVVDARDDGPSTRAIRALNAKVGKDERVDCALVAMCDGILVVRKR